MLWRRSAPAVPSRASGHPLHCACSMQGHRPPQGPLPPASDSTSRFRTVRSGIRSNFLPRSRRDRGHCHVRAIRILRKRGRQRFPAGVSWLSLEGTAGSAARGSLTPISLATDAHPHAARTGRFLPRVAHPRLCRGPPRVIGAGTSGCGRYRGFGHASGGPAFGRGRRPPLHPGCLTSGRPDIVRRQLRTALSAVHKDRDRRESSCSGRRAGRGDAGRIAAAGPDSRRTRSPGTRSPTLR